MNDDGSGPVELDPTFNSASIEPQFHPLLDGQLLFTSYNGDKRDIWRKSVSIVDGSTVNTLLTNDSNADDHSPAWGPDASFIVYISDFDGTPNLWEAEATGEFPRQVTAFALPAAAADPCVSPVAGDNTCLLSVTRDDGGSDLVIVDLVSGAVVRNLTSTDGPQP
jgi:Tol biopolymer transport system component